MTWKGSLGEDNRAEVSSGIALDSSDQLVVKDTMMTDINGITVYCCDGVATTNPSNQACSKYFLYFLF